uniref:Uncharacterized protein n=1 Tax=Arundo donax TaxID=35708 RepID=A0A0A9HCC3_ARUDO
MFHFSGFLITISQKHQVPTIEINRIKGDGKCMLNIRMDLANPF